MERQSTRQRLHHKVFFLTLCVIACTFPYSISANRFTIILLVANWLFEGDFKRKWNVVKSNITVILLISFYFLHAVALLYTTNMDEGMYQLEKKISFLVFTVVIVTTQPLTRREFKFVMASFVASVVVVSFICLGYAVHRNNYDILHPYWFYFSYNDLTEIVGLQPNYLAVFTGFAIIIVFYFIVENSTKYRLLRTLMMYALILYLTVFLVLLAGRTPLAATLAVVGAGYLWYFYQTKRLLRGLAIVTVIVIALGFLVYQIPIMRERMLQTFGVEQTTEWINQMGNGEGGLPSVRLMKWQSSWNIIKENWFIGISPGDTQDALQEEYKKMGFQLAYDERFNPHNQFLQVWVGLGIIGLIVYLATFWIPLRKAIADVDYLFIAFIAFFIMCCLTESILERQFGIIFYALFNAMFLQHQHDSVTKPGTGQ
ncbi:MAG TPA: O-antigen ligase family protein [Cyclobacteriaceae bacterium]|nr:O-antigen ligase family protein [Cyclobacteriaceae bacterium]